MITDERLTAFINSLDMGNPAYLNELEKEARETNVPIIRTETQSLLRTLISINRPARILEVGTAIGFSALCMSEYAPQGCQITTIEKYEKRINELVNSYSKQIIKIKSGQKAQEKAIKKQESQNISSKNSSTTTENRFFTVTVPKSWGSDWNVKVEDNSMNGIESKLYMFDHGHGGAAVYVLDMSDTSRPLAHYSRMIPDDCESVGTTSDGYEVFMTEAADGFFSQGAKITLK